MEQNVPNNAAAMQQQPRQMQQQNAPQGVSLIDIAFKCLHYWYLIVLSVAVFLAAGIYYVKSQEQIYSRTAAILIKTQSQNGGGKGIKLDGGNEMGLFNNTSEVDNELIAIQSPSLLAQTISRLHLNMNYSTDGFLHNVTLYGNTLPIHVDLKDVQETESASLVLKLKDGSYTITGMSKNGIAYSQPQTGKVGETVKTPIGSISITRGPAYRSFLKAEGSHVVYISHPTMDGALAGVKGRFKAEINGKQSSVINLTYVDVNIQRAEDFLNTLISVYSENWVNDRNQICLATNEFIAERIKVIEQELGNVDSHISQYKSSNLIPDVQAVGNMNLQEVSEVNKQILELSNQLATTRFVRQYITNSANAKKLIPAITGIGSNGIQGQIEAYNTKMLQRNSMAANSSEHNVMVQNLDADLEAMHSAIVSSIDNQISILNTQMASSRGEEAHATDKLASNPNQEKYLLSIERQQSVKEALYTFLLQKREENELSQAFVAYNTRIITSPCGSNSPIGPVRDRIMLICLALGLCLPIGLIYINEAMITTVRGRKDLENMITPLLGEIPEAEYRKKNIFQRIRFKYDSMYSRLTGIKHDHRSDSQLDIVVKADNNDVINEAFRIIRANMKFDNSKANKVIMITSANSGSGKTFVTANLGASFAILKTRVLLIDLDMRKKSLSKMFKLKGKGMANYLAHQTADYTDMIVHSTEVEGLDILPVGNTPPNPTELLNDERLERMLQELRSQYDLILLDCPPAEIVADTSIIAPHTDRTVFIVRANLFQRDLIPEIDKMFTSRIYGNMSVLLNGTLDTYGKYGYRKYGYSYGYHYGYGSKY